MSKPFWRWAVVEHNGRVFVASREQAERLKLVILGRHWRCGDELGGALGQALDIRVDRTLAGAAGLEFSR